MYFIWQHSRFFSKHELRNAPIRKSYFAASFWPDLILVCLFISLHRMEFSNSGKQIGTCNTFTSFPRHTDNRVCPQFDAATFITLHIMLRTMGGGDPVLTFIMVFGVTVDAGFTKGRGMAKTMAGLIPCGLILSSGAPSRVIKGQVYNDMSSGT